MDTGDRSKLIAARLDVEGIREYLGADSLVYITLDRMLRAIGTVKGGFCTACLTGEYPVPVPATAGKDVLENTLPLRPALADTR